MSERKVVVIGPFPPPVHGMAKNLKLFLEHVSEKENVASIDVSPGTIVRGGGYHLTKALKVMKGVFILSGLAMMGRVRSIYMPPDAGFGAYYSFLFVIMARMFSIPLFLHHRSFAYINKKTLGMSLITRFQPANTTHIFLCEKMKSSFYSVYGEWTKSMVVSNAQYVSPQKEVKSSSNELVVGHLSNLGFEKGLKQVFEVCEILRGKGVEFRLELAGPAENDSVYDYLVEQLEHFEGLVNYHGVVSGGGKHEFYKKIDCFLFPSHYRNEAQPNVLFEAMSYGAPVFSVGVGCIRGDVVCGSGYVFDNQRGFPRECADVLANLAADTKELESLKVSTLRIISEESKASKDSYNQMVSAVCMH